MSKPEEIIKEHGWVFRTSCRCGGKLQYKYRNQNYPNLELVLFVHQFAFVLKDRAKTLVNYSNVGILEKTLQKYEKIST